MKEILLDIIWLRQNYKYNPVSGEVLRDSCTVGFKDGDRHCITILQKKYSLPRIIYMLYYGYDPYPYQVIVFDKEKPLTPSNLDILTDPASKYFLLPNQTPKIIKEEIIPFRSEHMELWLPLPEKLSKYNVSTWGRVRRISDLKILSISITKNLTAKISLRVEGKVTSFTVRSLLNKGLEELEKR